VKAKKNPRSDTLFILLPRVLLLCEQMCYALEEAGQTPESIYILDQDNELIWYRLRSIFFLQLCWWKLVHVGLIRSGKSLVGYRWIGSGTELERKREIERVRERERLSHTFI